MWRAVPRDFSSALAVRQQTSPAGFLCRCTRVIPIAHTTKDGSLNGRLSLKITGHQVIGTFTSLRINLGRDRVNQWAIELEGAESALLIGGHTRLNSFQRIFGHEKRSF